MTTFLTLILVIVFVTSAVHAIATTSPNSGCFNFIFNGDWGNNVPSGESGVPYEGSKVANQVNKYLSQSNSFANLI